MGSPPPMPRQPTPAETSAANISEMEARARLDAQTAATKAASDAAQKTKDIQATQDKTNQAYSSAIGYGNQQLSAKGLDPSNDPYGIMDLYRGGLDLAKGSIPEISSNPGTYLGPQVFDTAYDTARGNQRAKLGREMDQFAGTGFERQAFGDTADDPYLAAILGTQQADARTQLDAAHNRGTINDYGYSGGLTDLERMFKGGMAKANDIGGGVLSGYQKQLTDRAGEGRSAIQNYDFGDTFSTAGAKADLSGLQGSLGGRLEGDIINAIGDTNFFDTSKLLASAGSRSGLVNPAAAAPLAGAANPLQKPTTTSTTGVF